VVTNWLGTKEAIELAKPANFVGKVVIDATNPLNAQYQLTDGLTNSGGELIQSWLPGAFVVKALNSIGYKHIIDPDFKGAKPDAFIAGDNEAAKTKVTELLGTIGWRDHVVDVGMCLTSIHSTIILTMPLPCVIGGIVESRLLEPLCLLWIKLFIKSGYNTGHGFALLRK
jgi:hypothetical protein